MSITTAVEFFLFMDMRVEFQWVSFSMTSRRWIVATEEYNARLEVLNKKQGLSTVKKNPRALLDKLGEIETKVSARIFSKNYTCMRLRYPYLFFH